MNTKFEDDTALLDVKGNKITQGSIVKMADENSLWSCYCGLVIQPKFNIAHGLYNVATFFNMEVPQVEFASLYGRNINICQEVIPVKEWDNIFGSKCRKSELDFLLENDSWKKCPRVYLFNPQELEVVEGWRREDLLRRAQSERYHSLYTSINSPPSSAFLCVCKDCINCASKTAFYKYFGNLSSYYVCDDCFLKINGKSGDLLPSEIC